jgi:hypothetical protein
MIGLDSENRERMRFATLSGGLFPVTVRKLQGIWREKERERRRQTGAAVCWQSSPMNPRIFG